MSSEIIAATGLVLAMTLSVVYQYPGAGEPCKFSICT